MSAITLAEPEYGVARSGPSREQNRRAPDGLVEDIPAVPFDTGAAGVYGPIRAATREKARMRSTGSAPLTPSASTRHWSPTTRLISPGTGS